MTTMTITPATYDIIKETSLLQLANDKSLDLTDPTAVFKAVMNATPHPTLHNHDKTWLRQQAASGSLEAAVYATCQKTIGEWLPAPQEKHPVEEIREFIVPYAQQALELLQQLPNPFAACMGTCMPGEHQKTD